MLTKNDLSAIEQIFNKNFDVKINPVLKKLNKLQKDMNTIVRVFDSDIVDLKNRTEKLERTVFATI